MPPAPREAKKTRGEKLASLLFICIKIKYHLLTSDQLEGWFLIIKKNYFPCIKKGIEIIFQWLLNFFKNLSATK